MSIKLPTMQEASATFLSRQPGFRRISTGTAMGPQIHGVLNDHIMVIHASGTEMVPPDTIYCGYRGSNWFEAPLTYSPYQYLVASDEEPHLSHIANVSVVNPDFLVKIVLES